MADLKGASRPDYSRQLYASCKNYLIHKIFGNQASTAKPNTKAYRQVWSSSQSVFAQVLKSLQPKERHIRAACTGRVPNYHHSSNHASPTPSSSCAGQDADHDQYSSLRPLRWEGQNSSLRPLWWGCPHMRVCIYYTLHTDTP